LKERSGILRKDARGKAFFRSARTGGITQSRQRKGGRKGEIEDSEKVTVVFYGKSINER
jgi:hypothetical protein